MAAPSRYFVTILGLLIVLTYVLACPFHRRGSRGHTYGDEDDNPFPLLKQRWGDFDSDIDSYSIRSHPHHRRRISHHRGHSLGLPEKPPQSQLQRLRITPAVELPGLPLNYSRSTPRRLPRNWLQLSGSTSECGSVIDIISVLLVNIYFKNF